jgi:hypothetical protein
MEDREIMKQEEIRKCTKVVKLFRSMMDELGDMCVVYDVRFGFIVLEYYMDGYFESNSNYNSARSVCMSVSRVSGAGLCGVEGIVLSGQNNR